MSFLIPIVLVCFVFLQIPCLLSLSSGDYPYSVSLSLHVILDINKFQFKLSVVPSILAALRETLPLLTLEHSHPVTRSIPSIVNRSLFLCLRFIPPFHILSSLFPYLHIQADR